MARKPFGSYMLEERLAVGGMGELFLASTSADRPLSVVKILHRDFLENPEFVAMFEDEGRIGSQLAHPNIVGVHDTGKVGEVPFIVFEFIDGENLRTVIKACSEAGMRVPAEIAVRIVVGVLLGLDHAHRARDDRGRPMNLVHRDLSPDNIVLSWDGEAKILDFGIAKADGRSTHTQVGILKGKSQYMAPEQAKLGVVDQRSDLYSAGIVLLELLSGRKRFDLDDPVQQILAAQDWTPYKPSDYAPGLPVEIDAIVLKALARAPDNRFQSADAFAASLTRVLQQGVLPRSEPIASFLRRLFPNRTKRAGVALDEQTLHPKGKPPAVSQTSPRTPLPTVRKPPAVAPAAASEEATATRSAEGPIVSALDDSETRATSAWADRETSTSPEWEEGGTRASAPVPSGDTDERTRARAPSPPPLLSEVDTATERAPIRGKPAQPSKKPFTDEVTADNERPTTKQPPTKQPSVAVKRSAEDDIPPPIIRPPGSTPRPGAGTGTGAFKLDIGIDEGVYEYDEDFAAPERKSGTPVAATNPQAAFPAVKKKTKPRRTAVKLLLGLALIAAASGAFSEYRASLESVPPIARVMAAAREKLGMPAMPAGDETPIAVSGTAGALATPEAVETASAPPTPEAAPSATDVPVLLPAATAAAVTAPKPNAAKPMSATIRVTSDPPGFPILLDGNATGKKTPATILIAPGDHVVSVDAPGYRPWEYEDFFKVGETKTVPAALIPE